MEAHTSNVIPLQLRPEARLRLVAEYVRTHERLAGAFFGFTLSAREMVLEIDHRCVVLADEHCDLLHVVVDVDGEPRVVLTSSDVRSAAETVVEYVAKQHETSRRREQFS